MHNVENPESTVQRVRVAEQLVHEEYNAANNDLDVMLVRLAEPLRFNEYITPVCLPNSDLELPSGTKCYTTGWGTLSSGGYMPDVLQQVQVPLISKEACNQPEWYDGEITDAMVCAGYEEGGKDSCQGDSGGPLVCYHEDSWLLIGITSWGHGCASELKPGVYTNVAKVPEWVKRKIFPIKNDYPGQI
jgi:secreted trypsin-like serine protease